MYLKIAHFPKTQLLCSFVEIMKISNSQCAKIFLREFFPVLKSLLKEIILEKLEDLNDECMDFIIEEYRSLQTLVIISVRKLSRRCMELLKSSPSIKFIIEAC